MVKRCQWGLCNSDNRYPDRLDGGKIQFIPFPKPKRSLEKCKRWIKACGRPHEQLNVNKVDGNKHMFVCSKHFPERMPTEMFPDPLPANIYDASNCTPARRPPRKQAKSEPQPKKWKILAEVTSCYENQQTTLDVVAETDPDATMALTSNTQSEGPTSLDMLALAAENRQLQQQLAQQTLANEALQKEHAKQILLNDDLRRENSSLRKTSHQNSCNFRSDRPFTVEMVRGSSIKDNFKYYTGFLFVQFMAIFKFLVPNKCNCPIKFSRTISSIKSMKLEDQLLLVLIKLRLNLDFKHIGTLFCISNHDAGSLFRTWINYMYYRLGSVPIWPHRDTLIGMMPFKFKEDFPTTMVILDGTEIKMERPSSLRSQSQCYSDYKSCTTLKGLVGIDPRGSFTFISMLFSGSISDKEITNRCGLLHLLQQLLDCGKLKMGDGVMVDKGFLIKDEIERLGLKLFIPPFASSISQMSVGDLALTRKIAKHRVHVERAISRAKKFKIVDHRIDLSLFPCVNQIWFCRCFLTNFMPYLIQD